MNFRGQQLLTLYRDKPMPNWPTKVKQREVSFIVHVDIYSSSGELVSWILSACKLPTSGYVFRSSEDQASPCWQQGQHTVRHHSSETQQLHLQVRLMNSFNKTEAAVFYAMLPEGFSFHQFRYLISSLSVMSCTTSHVPKHSKKVKKTEVY